MGRRPTIKRELTHQPALTEAQAPQSQPSIISTGDTVDSSDVTMTDGQTDEEIQISACATSTNGMDKSAITSPHIEHGGPEGGLHVLGRGVKELVQAVLALRHLGVEDLSLPLPKIVVVGDQSTGKSSLIEGISEIKVPRSAGTCTRCPLEINLSENTALDAQWNCKVFLHQKYTYQRGNSKGEAPTKARPLGPWVDSDGEHLPFAHVISKDDIVDALERAQLATLNPGTSFEKYRPGNPLPNRLHQVKFSPNIIRLDICGPGLPNLSFFDLPGVINVSEVPGEAYLVDLVRNLVKAYIKTPGCINLLALTMTHDVANSSAFGLIRELKAEARTMGCLTKPDRMITDDTLNQWAEILEGEAFQLGFGYHVVKNNQNPKVDHVTARREEAAFFSSQAPWTTELSSYNKRFGTLQLQTELSQHLTAQIRTSLPVIIEQVRQKVEMIKSQLGELPEPLGNNLAPVVMGEIMTFEKHIDKQITGGAPGFPFQKEWDNITQTFRQDLTDTRPILVFSTARASAFSQQSPSIASAVRHITPIPIDSDDDDENDTTPSKSSQAGNKRPPSSSYSTPTKFLKTNRGVPSVVPIRKGAKRFHLPEVRNICLDAYEGGLHNINPKAIETMISISMEHWQDPLDQFMTRTRELCEEMVFEQVQKVYGKHLQTEYHETIRQICEAFFDNTFAKHHQLARRILKWEQAKPKTCNDPAMRLAEAETLAVLHKKSRDLRAEAYLCEQERKSGKQTTGQGRLEKIEKITDGQLNPEKYSQEIDAISIVKAYYECAHYRFVDTVSASVRCELFEKCRQDIVNEMKSVFRLTEAGVEERLALLLAANPEQEGRRAQLIRDLDTVNQAQERLNDLTGDE